MLGPAVPCPPSRHCPWRIKARGRKQGLHDVFTGLDSRGRVGWVTEEEVLEAPPPGREAPPQTRPGCAQTHLFLHPAFKQHRHTRLDGEGDLPAADREVLLQGLPEGRLLHPGLWGRAEAVGERVGGAHPPRNLPFLSSRRFS